MAVSCNRCASILWPCLANSDSAHVQSHREHVMLGHITHSRCACACTITPHNGAHTCVNILKPSGHKVYLKTCDGGSWTGNRSQPTTGEASSRSSSSDGGGGSGAALHYRGRAILDATAAALLTLGVSDATEVVVGGGSAGALGVCVLLSL
jgi:hypothetical protein